MLSQNPTVSGLCRDTHLVPDITSQWIAALYGPVCILSCDPVFLGAEVHTNNTGELSAIGEACKWLPSFLQGPVDNKPPHAVICYDSEYAYSLATRLANPTTNKQLAESVASLVTMEHVRGHTGIYGNEVADRLADRGARGRVSPHAPHWITPPPGPMGGQVDPPRPKPKARPKRQVLRKREAAPANLVPIPDRPGYFRSDICNEGFRKGDLSQHQPYRSVGARTRPIEPLNIVGIF